MHSSRKAGTGDKNEGVFVCYRHNDSSSVAGRLYDFLSSWFPHRVFMDVENMDPGSDFRQQLSAVMEQCGAVVAVIGPSWLSSMGAYSEANTQDDYVRAELQQAIDLHLTVIPILLDGTRMPTTEELPDSIRDLQFHHALEVRTRHFPHDISPLRAALCRTFVLRPPTLWEEFIAKLPGAKTIDETARKLYAKLSLITGVFSILGLLSRDTYTLAFLLSFISWWTGLVGMNSKRFRFHAIGGMVASSAGLLGLLWLLTFTHNLPGPSLPKAGDIRVFGASRMEFVYVPAGEFTMGSDVAERNYILDERPRHEVYLDGFWIGRYEVTNRQFAQFVDDSGYGGAERWRQNYSPGHGQEEYPVSCVSWDDAAAYCRWMGGRLPTEAEWEKTARGTDARAFPWGNDWDKVLSQPRCTVANLADRNTNYAWSDPRVDDGFKETAPVGSFLEGSSPYGAMDMAGNVQEWCSDWFEDGYYRHSPSRNPKGPASGKQRIVRGGSCDSGRDHLACSARGVAEPSEAWSTGFRVVVALEH